MFLSLKISSPATLKIADSISFALKNAFYFIYHQALGDNFHFCQNKGTEMAVILRSNTYKIKRGMMRILIIFTLCSIKTADVY